MKEETVKPRYELKPYQEETVSFSILNKYSIVALQQGLGKSLVAIEVAVKTQSKTLIVCPAYLKFKWASEIRKFTGNKYSISIFDTEKQFYPLWDTDFCIIAYSKVDKAEVLFEWADMVVLDECFHRDTYVETPLGVKKICDIRVGDLVRNFSGFGKVKAISRNFVSDWVKLKYNGKEVICSTSHPFYTDRGWVEAGKLKRGDKIYANDRKMYREGRRKGEAVKGLCKESIQGDKVYSLWFGVFCAYLESSKILLQKMSIRLPISGVGKKTYSHPYKNMQGVWGRISNILLSVPQAWVYHLLKKMQIHKFRKTGYDAATRKKEWCWCNRSSGEDEAEVEGYWTQTENSRREWKRLKNRDVYKGRFGEVGINPQLYIKRNTESIYKYAHALQTGFWRSLYKSVCGDRRPKPQLTKSKRSRQEEGGSLNAFRLEGIEIQKSRGVRGQDESYFYDLEISGHPSFTVNGALVHNCTYVKSTDTLRGRSSHKLIFENSIKRVMLLTGTPILNRVYEFYSLIAITFYNPELPSNLYQEFTEKFPTYVDFANHFSHLREFKVNQMVRGKMIQVKVKQWNGIQNVSELKKLLVGRYIRFTTDEIPNMPSYVDVPVVVAQEDIPELLDMYDSIAEGRSSSVMSDVKAKAALAKTKYTHEYVTSLLEAGESVVVYSDHVESCQRLGELFGVVGITGATKMALRQQMADDFMAGKSKVIVATIGSFSTGIDLIAANNLVFNDFNFVPGNMDQAKYRIRRIGQTKTCFFHYIISSFQDEIILSKIEEKQSVIDQII